MGDTPDLTGRLADYACQSRFADLPEAVRHEAVRVFLNWVGVAIGGSGEPAVAIAAAQAADLGATPRAAIIGQGLRTEPGSAAFVNCISAAVLAYDDAYLPSVAHPGSPAAAALFAVAQDRPVGGEEFLNALALSVEIQCRMANLLALPPSRFHPALYVNGFSGPVGVAVGVGRLIGLGPERMRWAIGIAASQASGFRGTHGTMTAHFRAGHASRAGLQAAVLAEKGFDCTPDALEGAGGMLEVYAEGADPDRALEGLGQRHLMLDNRCKPYPCGIVIHPVIDACLAIRSRMPAGHGPGEVHLTVNPTVLTLTGKRHPETMLAAANSVFHWAAASLLRGTAGLPQMQLECIERPDIAALRDRIVATADARIGKGEAVAETALPSGEVLREHVVHARGSLERPMDDRDLEAKFRGVVEGRMTEAATANLLEACRAIRAASDVGAAIGGLLP